MWVCVLLRYSSLTLTLHASERRLCVNANKRVLKNLSAFDESCQGDQGKNYVFWFTVHHLIFFKATIATLKWELVFFVVDISWVIGAVNNLILLMMPIVPNYLLKKYFLLYWKLLSADSVNSLVEIWPCVAPSKKMLLSRKSKFSKK